MLMTYYGNVSSSKLTNTGNSYIWSVSDLKETRTFRMEVSQTSDRFVVGADTYDQWSYSSSFRSTGLSWEFTSPGGNGWYSCYNAIKSGRTVYLRRPDGGYMMKCTGWTEGTYSGSLGYMSGTSYWMPYTSSYSER